MIEPKPGEKPFLLQDELKDDPWKLLVACILLNKAPDEAVIKVIWDVLSEYPIPSAMGEANFYELKYLIRKLGLSDRRAQYLISMSTQYDVTNDQVSDYPGCGRYAQDSYDIFVKGNMDIEVTDKVLQAYLDWYQHKE